MRDLRRQVHEIDKRQESFEVFVRENIKAINEQMTEFKAQMTEFKAQMAEFREDSKKRDEQFHNLIWNATITWSVGIVSVIIAIFVATKP